MMSVYKNDQNHYDFNDFDDTDNVSDDEVFIGDSRRGFDDDSSVSKPLMAPRRKQLKPNQFHTQIKRIPPCQAFCAPVCYGLIAFGAIIGIVCLVIFLVNMFTVRFGYFQIGSNRSKEFNFLVGCSHLEIEDVWIQNFPKLLTESAIRLNDVNRDGILDVLIGFATGADGYHVPVFECDIYFDGVKPCFGGVLALDGKDGTEIWRHYTDHEIFALNCNEDLTLDGIKDCLAGGRAGTFQAVNGKDGTLIWNFGPQEAKNDIMNVYTAQFLPDQDGDGIVDILATHGGDPLAEPGSEYRLSGRLLLLSGKDGKVLKWLGVPDNKESYYSPQRLVHPDGTELILFGTGGETHSGGLWYLKLDDLIKGDMHKAQLIYQDTHKGVMTPPVLADITGDKIDDVIISLFNSTVIAFNGLNFEQIWNFSIPSSETYSTPAAGYYNEDDILDFLIKYQIGPGFPIYYFSQTTILNGATGKPMLAKPIQDTVGAQASGLSISMEGNGNDLFIYWTSDCLGHEGEKQEFTFVKGTNVHEQSRANFCNIRFKSRLISRLFAIGRNFKPPGILIYHSDDRKSIEYNNTVNTSALALNYVKAHPDVWHLYRQYAGVKLELNPKKANRKLPKLKTKPAMQQRGKNSFENSEFEEDVAYPQRHNIRKHGRYKAANRYPTFASRPDLSYLDSINQDYDNQNMGEGGFMEEPTWRRDGEPGWYKNYRPNYRENRFGYQRTPHREHYGDEVDWTNQLAYDKRIKRKINRIKRHVGPHDNDGIQRLISTGTLAPVLLDPIDPKSKHSIDLIFATYWFFPAKTQAILPEDRDCIQEKMEKEQERFIPGNRYYGMDHDAFESAITKECLSQTKHDSTTNQTHETQSEFDPFNIHMGQMTVYRLRLHCTCADDARVKLGLRTCAKILPYEEQGWAAYMGTNGDSHYVKRKG